MENFLSPSALTYSFIILLIIIGGVFSLFDYSLSFCRKSRLEKENAKRFKAVLSSLDDPPDQKHHLWSGRRNLSLACRIWCNIFRVFSSFLAGITCAAIIIKYSNIPSWIIIILYALLLGILTSLLSDSLPKMISRLKPEAVASSFLPVMKILCLPMTPLSLTLLKFVSFFRTTISPENDNSITEEELQDELRNTLLEGEKSGIVESKELSMVEGVFYLGDRPVAAFMKHRSEIQWLDIKASYEEIRDKALEFKSQRCFPVADGNPDAIAGAAYIEDIILDFSQPQPRGLRAIMKKAQFIPETMTALKAFESFKHGQADFLFVMDEYGGLAGLISVRTLVEEIVGELSAPAASDQPFIKQEDGSYLADGTLNIDDAARELSLTGLGEDSDFHTLAGLILHLAGELPHVGDSYDYQGYKFTVVDKDGNRIDKVLIKKAAE